MRQGRWFRLRYSERRMLRMRALAVAVALVASSGLAAPVVVAVDIDGVIHPVTEEIVEAALVRAKGEGASALLLRLNTPGGMLDATRRIIERLDASPVPVITYVTPSGGRAASAGFFLLEAGDVAAMAPGTNTGAASPVLLGQQMDPVMRAKVENDSAALMRSLTSRRGRNTELAEKTIRQAVSVTDREALEQHLIELVEPDEKSLIAALEGRTVIRIDGRSTTLHLAGARVDELPLTMRQRFLSAIADPNTGFILLVLGALGLYIEFTHPGLIAPGVIGAMLALLGFASLSLFPIDWIGAALLVLALVLFVLEAKFASHGILGAGGAAAMILGSMLLVEGPPELRIHFLTAVATTLPFAAITIFLVSLVLKARAAKVITGISGMTGELAVARTPLDPSGRVFVRGELWNAVSTRPAAEGSLVRVLALEDGLTLRVEPAGETEKPPSGPPS
jgi:membrane-bound serine protease (ClpP class)